MYKTYKDINLLTEQYKSWGDAIIVCKTTKIKQKVVRRGTLAKQEGWYKNKWVWKKPPTILRWKLEDSQTFGEALKQLSLEHNKR